MSVVFIRRRANNVLLSQYIMKTGYCQTLVIFQTTISFYRRMVEPAHQPLHTTACLQSGWTHPRNRLVPRVNYRPLTDIFHNSDKPISSKWRRPEQQWYQNLGQNLALFAPSKNRGGVGEISVDFYRGVSDHPHTV